MSRIRIGFAFRAVIYTVTVEALIAGSVNNLQYLSEPLYRLCSKGFAYREAATAEWDIPMLEHESVFWMGSSR